MYTPMNDEHAANQPPVSLSNLDRRYPVERIQWIDSSGRDRWDTAEAYVEWAKMINLVCESVGYLVLESDDRVALVQNISSASMDNMMVIPKVAIQLRVRLSDE